MKISYPAYYDLFRCIAGQCPDSCCHQWDVQVDEASAAYYRSLPGELGDKLRQVMDEEDGETVMRKTADGRCPMWRRDGLCEIQAALGEGALCHVCSQFPRLVHDFGDFQEWGLELSCPEAARLILSGQDRRWVTQDTPETGTADYDEELMSILRATRPQAISILQDTAMSPAEALAVLLLYGYEVQARIDGGEDLPFHSDRALAQARELANGGSIADMQAFFLGLEILTPQWQALLESQPQPAAWVDSMRHLAQYFVERYWLQAVADFDLVSRVKFCVASCLMIRALGGDLHTAQLYSKEIENSIDNVEAILDGAYTSPALADIHLLGLLLR